MRLDSKKGRAWSLIAGLFLVTSLACNFVNLGRFGREEPTAIVVSTQVAGQLVDNIGDAIATAKAGGTATLVMTEEQLTSLANTEMQKSSGSESDIKDLQIRLRDGLVRISGTVKQNGFSMRANIDVAIKIDAQGKIHSEIVSARVGPFSIPENMLDELTSMLDRYLVEQITSDGKQLVVEQITIEDGKMTIVGKLK